MKTLKWIIIILAILALIGFIAYQIVDKPLPKGLEGPKAENLADKMLTAVNDSAWEATDVVAWNFADRHQHIWDKNRHFAKVSWDDTYEVFVNLNTLSGVVIVKGKQIKDSAGTAELVKDAYEYWANDSFWLNPIVKIRDAGTRRFYVETEDPSTEALLVSYTAGGLTPGDSYLWIVDKSSGLPQLVKMWVQVIPVGGVEFTWENWIKTETGALIATEHKGLITVIIDNIQTYQNISGLAEGDIFTILQ